MVKKAKVDYDYENDVLYVYTDENIKDSLGIDNFIIDFSPNNVVVGVEVLDASQILSNMLEEKITKKILSEIMEVGISVYQGREIIFITLVLHVIIRKQKTDLRIPIPDAPMVVSV